MKAMGKRERSYQWIGSLLNGRRISFTDSKTSWKLIYKISEKTCQTDYPLPFESVTVFICEQLSGDDVGQRAVMKVRTECVVDRNGIILSRLTSS